MRAVRLSSRFPGIDIDRVLVAERIPTDEDDARAERFYRVMARLFRAFGPHVAGLPSVPEDRTQALAAAYTDAHRRLFPAPVLPEEFRNLDLGALATAIRIVGIVILAPFAEETLFRGVLQSELRDRMAAWPAILIQAAVFTALHALSLVGSSTVAFDIAQLLFEGTIYGWVRHTTRSLYPSMAMHAMGNAVAVLERLLL